MKVTIEQTPKVPKHPYFIVKNRLSCVNDYGIGRILWCPNPGLTILFKKGNGDERLAASIGGIIGIIFLLLLLLIYVIGI